MSKLKRKAPTGIKLLRLVTVLITLLVILVLGSIVYSVYEDYTAFTSNLNGAQFAGKAVLQGSSETITMNVTVPNKGVYPLSVAVACSPRTTNVVCQPAEVVVQPGQQGVLRFRLTVANVQQFLSSGDHRIDGTVTMELVPLSTLSVSVDFGGFIKSGGP